MYIHTGHVQTLMDSPVANVHSCMLRYCINLTVIQEYITCQLQGAPAAAVHGCQAAVGAGQLLPARLPAVGAGRGGCLAGEQGAPALQAPGLAAACDPALAAHDPLPGCAWQSSNSWLHTYRPTYGIVSPSSQGH